MNVPQTRAAIRATQPKTRRNGCPGSESSIDAEAKTVSPCEVGVGDGLGGLGGEGGEGGNGSSTAATPVSVWGSGRMRFSEVLSGATLLGQRRHGAYVRTIVPANLDMVLIKSLQSESGAVWSKPPTALTQPKKKARRTHVSPCPDP